MDRLRYWASMFGLSVVAIAVSYVWIDRPLAYYAHSDLAQYKIFVQMQRLPNMFPGAAAAILIAVWIWSLVAQPLPRFARVAAIWGVSLFVAVGIKDQLKYLFGRTWPETWINNNPSLIHDGAFGFNPLHGGVGYASFPSGHSAAICAAMSVLWVCYPRLRALYALAVAIVVAGLIGADYHFLSDIIAGGFLGTAVGVTAVHLAGLRPAKS